MASRIKVKTLVGLILGIIIVMGGVVGATLYVMNKSGEDYEKKGDAFAAVGDWEEAARMYGQAVGHDKMNLVWLEKWRDAKLQFTFETQTEYDNAYQEYVSILSQIATSAPQNVEFQHDILSNLEFRLKVLPFRRDRWEQLITETESSLRTFEDSEMGENAWHSLKRYRGMALVRFMIHDLPMERDQVQLARQDLEDALAVRPEDADVAVALAQWHTIKAMDLEEQLDSEGAKVDRDEALRILGEFHAANPNDVISQVMLFEISMDSAVLRIDPTMAVLERLKQNKRIVEGLKPKLRELMASISKIPPADLTIDGVNRLYSSARRVDNDYASEQARELCRKVLDEKPADIFFLNFLGSLLNDSGNYEEAEDVYGRIRSLEIPSLSFEGLILFGLKTDAIYSQARSVIGQYSSSDDDSTKQKLLDRLKSYLVEMTEKLPERDPRLLITEARIKLMENERGAAMRLLTEYNELTKDSDLEAVLLLGRVAREMNQPGTAIEQFRKLAQALPNNVIVLESLADLEHEMKNTLQAISLYEALVLLEPENERYNERLAFLRAITGQGKAKDPVEQILIEAQRISTGIEGGLPDQTGAIEHLKASLESAGHSARIYDLLVRLEYSQNPAEARNLLAEGLKHSPDDEILLSLQRRLVSDDPVDAMLATIDESPIPEMEKLMNKYAVLQNADREEDAKALLGRAIEIDPEEPRVLELRFQDLLRDDKIDEAKALANRAAELDVDQADGLTFLARIEIANEEYEKAMETLQLATRQGTVNAQTWRLLGSLQVNRGYPADAIASFRKSLEIKPDDLRTIVTYVDALVSMNRMDEALAIARGSQQYGRNSRGFMFRWLDLEANYGDKQLALSLRKSMYERSPSDSENRISLISLLINLRQFKEAGEHIDAMRADNDSLQLVMLDAQRHADRGGLGDARSIFLEYITKLDRDTMTVDPYIAFGRFMIDRGESSNNDDAVKTGLSALIQAVQYQDEDSRIAERVLADSYFKLNMNEDAIKIYQQLIESGTPDENGIITKRITESFIRTGRYQEAKQRAEADPNADTDLTLLLLRAEAAKGMGNIDEAREILDRTITAFPKEALPFLKRAETMQGDPSLLRDALADIDAAMRLRPNFWQALRLRANLLALAGRTDDAVDDLRKAAQAAPDIDELRVGVMRELLRRDLVTEAVEVANRAIARRPSDITRILSCGDLFAMAEQWRHATKYYALAWEQGADPAIAHRYAGALLRMSTPDLARAISILSAPEIGVEKEPLLRMLRALYHRKRGDIQASANDATASFDIVRDEPPRLVRWYRDLHEVFDDDAQFQLYMEQIAKTRGEPDWLIFLHGRDLLEDSSQASQVVERLKSLAEKTEDQTLKLAIYKSISSSLYASGQYEQSAAMMKKGLGAFASDTELNNNLAYTLAVHLDRADEALSYAELAVRSDSGTSTIYDTLGTIQLKLGKLDAAQQTLREALNLPTTPADKVLISVHLGKVLLAMGLQADAQKLADDAQQIFEYLSDDEKQRVETELKEFQSQL